MKAVQPNICHHTSRSYASNNKVSNTEVNGKKVWLLIDSLTFGGIETHVLELAKGLRSMNVDISVVFVTQYSSPSLLAEKLELTGIPFFFLNISFPTGSSLISLLKSISRHQPQLIHAHGYKASILSKFARLLVNNIDIRLISTYHAGEAPKGKVWLYDFIDRYTAVLSDARLSVSNQIQDKVPAISQRLNNFVDINTIDFTHGSQIAFVGRLSHEKAPDRFVELASLNSTTEFHCYGSGPMENELLENAPSNLLFHGHQSSMEQIWSEIGFLIMPSRYEGLPMAALEAMSRGIPLLCTKVGDLHKLISHGENGFIVNREEDLNHQLGFWLSMSESEQLTMRYAARNTIRESYSTQSVLPDLLSIYRI